MRILTSYKRIHKEDRVLVVEMEKEATIKVKVAEDFKKKETTTQMMTQTMIEKEEEVEKVEEEVKEEMTMMTMMTVNHQFH